MQCGGKEALFGHGYAGTSPRDITLQVNVNQALVKR